MKRNTQLVDSIIELVHSNQDEWIQVDQLASLVGLSGLQDVEDSAFLQHLTLCIEAGWLEMKSNPTGSEKPKVVRLTWAGHDAVEAGQGRWS